jgi:uncharacterized protein
MSHTHEVRKVQLPSIAIGVDTHLLIHTYGPKNSGKKAYIQASLHADELPGLLVCHHLINMLERADKLNLIDKEIVIVPFANPIGLSQNFLGMHMGRFNLATGVNFNRGYPNLSDPVAARIEGKLHPTDAAANVELIRAAMRSELDETLVGNGGYQREQEEVLKRTLMREAVDADVVLDLHCDTGMFRLN